MCVCQVIGTKLTTGQHRQPPIQKARPPSTGKAKELHYCQQIIESLGERIMQSCLLMFTKFSDLIG